MNTLRKELDPDAYYEFIKPDTITGKPYSWWRQSVGLPNLGIVSYSDNAEWAIKLDWMVSSEDNYWTTKFGIPESIGSGLISQRGILSI